MYLKEACQATVKEAQQPEAFAGGSIQIQKGGNKKRKANRSCKVRISIQSRPQNGSKGFQCQRISLSDENNSSKNRDRQEKP